MNIVKMIPIKRKNPKTGRLAWYVQKARYDTMGGEALIEAMARNTGITKARVGMAVDAIIKQMKNFLLNGHSVTITNLGTFTPVVKSRPSELAEEVGSGNIKSLRFKFRPTASIREDYRNTVGYSITDSNPTEGGSSPAPADPLLGIRALAYTNPETGEWVNVNIDAGTTSVNIVRGAGAVALKTADVKGGYFSAQGNQMELLLKKATGVYAQQGYDFVCVGPIFSNATSLDMYYYAPSSQEGQEVQGVQFNITNS